MINLKWLREDHKIKYATKIKKADLGNTYFFSIDLLAFY
jgi:hypothetical protein